MKNNKSILTSLLIAVVTLFSASIAQAEQPREVTLHFKKGTVIEVAYASIKEGKHPLFEEYFSKVLPIGPRYDFQPLGMFGIQESNSMGQSLSVQPQIVGFFQWPSVEAFLRLHEDPDFLAAVPLRTEAVSYLNNGNFYTVDEDIDITIREDRLYSIMAEFMESDSTSHMNMSHGMMDTVVLKRHILSDASQSIATAASNLVSDHDYKPETITLSENSDMGSHSESHQLVGGFSFPPKN